jgi:hypothetical protein
MRVLSSWRDHRLIRLRLVASGDMGAFLKDRTAVRNLIARTHSDSGANATMPFLFWGMSEI